VIGLELGQPLIPPPCHHGFDRSTFDQAKPTGRNFVEQFSDRRFGREDHGAAERRMLGDIILCFGSYSRAVASNMRVAKGRPAPRLPLRAGLKVDHHWAQVSGNRRRVQRTDCRAPNGQIWPPVHHFGRCPGDRSNQSRWPCFRSTVVLKPRGGAGGSSGPPAGLQSGQGTPAPLQLRCPIGWPGCSSQTQRSSRHSLQSGSVAVIARSGRGSRRLSGP
jgi:hypothetical protein